VIRGYEEAESQARELYDRLITLGKALGHDTTLLKDPVYRELCIRTIETKLDTAFVKGCSAGIDRALSSSK